MKQGRCEELSECSCITDQEPDFEKIKIIIFIFLCLILCALIARIEVCIKPIIKDPS